MQFVRVAFLIGITALIVVIPEKVTADERDVWVAVGYGGRRMISTDGRNWEITAEWKQPAGDDKFNLMDVVCVDGKFVAVGGGGRGKDKGGHILISEDGRQWQPIRTDSNRVFPIVFGDDRFVVGAPNRQLLWSNDAENWFSGAKIPDPVATHFRMGAYGNGVFVFLGNHGGKKLPYWCMTTSDGRQLTSFDKSFPRVRAIRFAKGRFVLVGDKGFCRSSVDGKNWESHDVDPSQDLRYLVWSGEKFYAGGRKLYTSADGREWGETEYRVKGDLLWSDENLFISSGWPGKMFYSTDLKSWKRSPELTENGINRVVKRRLETAN